MEREEKIKSTSRITMDVTLKLTEEEARALHSITVYGTGSFLEFFYKHLGKNYLLPNEKGLISLFNTIEQELPAHIDKINEARKLLQNNFLWKEKK